MRRGLAMEYLVVGSLLLTATAIEGIGVTSQTPDFWAYVPREYLHAWKRCSEQAFESFGLIIAASLLNRSGSV